MILFQNLLETAPNNDKLWYNNHNIYDNSMGFQIDGPLLMVVFHEDFDFMDHDGLLPSWSLATRRAAEVFASAKLRTLRAMSSGSWPQFMDQAWQIYIYVYIILAYIYMYIMLCIYVNYYIYVYNMYMYIDSYIYI